MNIQTDKTTSVIIVNYNTSKLVVECIHSLQSESFDKIVVVDNNSLDENPGVITELFPDTVLIRNSVNAGFGEGCNTGMQWVIKNTLSDFMLFLNPDTVIEPELIGQLENRMTEADIGIVTPVITMMHNKNLLWYGGGFFSWLKGSARVPGFGKSSLAPLAQTERDVEFASGCAFMIKRSVVEQCRGFDPAYFMYEEDVELSLRVLAAGYRIRYVPEAIVRHHGQGSFSLNAKPYRMFDAKNPRLPFFVYQAARNRFQTVFRHGSIGNRIIFILGFTAWFGIKGIGWIRYFRFDAFRALFRGVRDFLKMKMSTNKVKS